MEDMAMLPDPQFVKERIDSNLQSLQNLSTINRSRAEVLDELAKDLAEYYGYLPELTALLLQLFSPVECREYMEASDHPRPLVIRTNTLKTTRKDLIEALTKRGAAVEAIEWSKVAIKVTESTVPIGATPEYLAGHYMLQSASSLNPVMALAPQPGEKVLDMSAAPGGKTSYIAQLMKNSGTVVANDLKAARQKATIGNLHRLGVKNTIVCCYDGRKIPTVFKGFDRVLLDAPCSGLGIISRDQSVKLQRTLKDIQRVAHLQKELLRAAIDTIDANSSTGGIIVYSTCSISVEENEMVIQYILQKRFVKVVETGLEVGKPGLTRHMEHRFHPSIANTRRFYPHVHNMDGFYVAKLKKYANGVRGEEDELKENESGDDEEEEVADMEVDEDNNFTTEEDEEEEEDHPSSKKKTQQKQEKRKQHQQIKVSSDTANSKMKNKSSNEDLEVRGEKMKVHHPSDESTKENNSRTPPAPQKKSKKRSLEEGIIPFVEKEEEEEKPNNRQKKENKKNPQQQQEKEEEKEKEPFQVVQDSSEVPLKKKKKKKTVEEQQQQQEEYVEPGDAEDSGPPHRKLSAKEKKIAKADILKQLPELLKALHGSEEENEEDKAAEEGASERKQIQKKKQKAVRNPLRKSSK